MLPVEMLVLGYTVRTRYLHGRPQEFFSGGAHILRWQKFNFVYKTKLLSAKKFNVSYVLRFSGYLN